MGGGGAVRDSRRGEALGAAGVRGATPPKAVARAPDASNAALSFSRLTQRLLVLKNLWLREWAQGWGRGGVSWGVGVWGWQLSAARSWGGRQPAARARGLARPRLPPARLPPPARPPRPPPAHSVMSSNLLLSSSGHMADSRSISRPSALRLARCPPFLSDTSRSHTWWGGGGVGVGGVPGLGQAGGGGAGAASAAVRAAATTQPPACSFRAPQRAA